MKTLKSLLDGRKTIPKATLTDKDIFYIFNRVIKQEFGNIGASKFTADYFKNGTVFVRSESPAWAAELFGNRSKIVREMNKELGLGAVSEIKTKK